MKNKIRFNIDEKSLFYGAYNDYARGQTATVSTPLNQSVNPEKWRNDILELRKYNCRIDNPTEMLIYQCKRSSHSGNEIDDIFVFDNLLLDGEKLETPFQFIMYMKRETDEYITDKHGNKTKNTHLGRIKLHYPITYRYKIDGYNIDNNAVLEAIKKQNGGFAFVVRGFEYCEQEKTLNIITSLIGPVGIPLSTVFKRAKGVGKMLMIDPKKVVDVDYVVVVEQTPDLKGNNISYELLNKTRAENGKIGEQFVYNLLLEKLLDKNELYHTSLYFPQSPYDIEYILDGKKRYIEVKSTSGTKPIFNMSSGELKFMKKYKEFYALYMVTEVKEAFPKYKIYTYDEIMKMRKEYPSIRFYGK